MTATEYTTTYWVCVDCYETHHGVREDWRPAPDREPLNLIPEDAEVTTGLLWGEHAEDCPNRAECDCEHDTFSWSPCDGCGSTLGGTRDALTVWEVSD